MSVLPELAELDAILSIGGDRVRVRDVASVDAGGRHFPVREITLGSRRRGAPAIGFFAGVHGLERIGTAVVLAYLRSLMVRLSWDDTLHALLDRVQMVFMPLVNPAGMWLGTRANPSGVDLMRNSPAESDGKVPFLVGGQRVSATLPWYRGAAGAPMEIESRALCETVEARLFDRPLALSLDCHSGFGARDRIWVPYARSRAPIEHLPEADALRRLFDDTYANHRYVFEPQSLQYLTHGDLWDHLYDRALNARRGLFLPLTLEMGSWLWVRKNPRQAFSRDGIFNPVATHRFQRVLRRHISFLDFLARACASHARWLPQEPSRSATRRAVVARWYGAPA